MDKTQDSVNHKMYIYLINIQENIQSTQKEHNNYFMISSLYLCKELLEVVKHQLWVHRQAGQGCVITHGPKSLFPKQEHRMVQKSLLIPYFILNYVPPPD